MGRGVVLMALLLLTPALGGCLGASDDALDRSAADGADAKFSTTHVFPGVYDTSGPFARTLEPGPFEPLEPTTHKLTSELDGADIHVVVRRPDVPAGTPVPVVAVASPYFPTEPDWDGPRIARYAENLIPHGYAMAVIAVRGTADSGGCTDMFGPREASDVSQAVTWLGERPWSNGNVGMVGTSYEGTTPWEVAGLGNPHLKTIVPIAGVPDPFGLVWRNGTVKAFHSVGLVSLFYTSYGFLLYNPTTDRSAENTVESILCPAAIEGMAASGVSSATGEPDPFGYWAQRDLRPAVLENYNGTVLLVQGLQDWNVLPSQFHPFTTGLQDQGVVVKHMLGQWGHATPDTTSDRNPMPRWDWAEILLHWFDRWLKEDPTVDIGPAVQVQDNELSWRSEQAWPPEDTVATTFHLNPGQELARTPSDSTASVTIAPSLPVPDQDRLFGNSTLQAWTHAEERLCPACTLFTTEPLDDELRIAGAPRVHVTVTPHGPGGQLTAWLYAQEEEGQRERLGWGAMDLRFAAGGRQAEEVVPGELLEVKLQLDPLDAVVREGQRLVLELHEGPWGDNYLPAKTPFPMDVEVGGGQSVLVVDTFDVQAEQFFRPPGVDG